MNNVLERETIDLRVSYTKEVICPEFEKMKAKDPENYSDANKELGLKTGDVVNFVNGYNIPMRTEIIGFDKSTGRAYLLWDCYWYSVNLEDRGYSVHVDA